MGRLKDQARHPLSALMDSHRGEITQAMIGRAVGHAQGWVSNYRAGEQDADIDELDQMARVFGLTLIELIDLRPNATEQEVLDAFRGLRAETRETWLKMMRQMSPAPRGRSRR